MWKDREKTRGDKQAGVREVRRQDVRIHRARLYQQDVKVVMRRQAWKLARNQRQNNEIDIDNTTVETLLNDYSTAPCTVTRVRRRATTSTKNIN